MHLCVSVLFVCIYEPISPLTLISGTEQSTTVTFWQNSTQREKDKGKKENFAFIGAKKLCRSLANRMCHKNGGDNQHKSQSSMGSEIRLCVLQKIRLQCENVMGCKTASTKKSLKSGLRGKYSLPFLVSLCTFIKNSSRSMESLPSCEVKCTKSSIYQICICLDSFLTIDKHNNVNIVIILLF